MSPGFGQGKSLKRLSVDLEALYRKYNRREFVHPDPLEFLYAFSDLYDREIVGLIVSTLAYGRVEQILKSCRAVLKELGCSPRRTLEQFSSVKIQKMTKSFRHRFTTGDDLSALLLGIKSAISKYGSLYECFLDGYRRHHSNLLLSLISFQKEITGSYRHCGVRLLPSPAKLSACKRLHLFLRWMVRKDAVDPGGWDEIPPSKLLIPLDVHMHRISLHLGFTNRKSADLETVLEVTKAFSEISPDDPVKYDFVLTRFGIRKDFKVASIFEK